MPRHRSRLTSTLVGGGISDAPSATDAILHEASEFHITWAKNRLRSQISELHRRPGSSDDPSEAGLAEAYRYWAHDAANRTSSEPSFYRREVAIDPLYRILPHVRIPVGLTDVWRGRLDAIAGPAYVPTVFFGLPDGSELPRAGLALWDRAIRLACEDSYSSLSQLPRAADRTRRAGQSILDNVVPFAAGLKRAVFFTAGGEAAPSQRKVQAAATRTELASLSSLDVAPLLDVLFAAVASDSGRGDTAREPNKHGRTSGRKTLAETNAPKWQVYGTINEAAQRFGGYKAALRHLKMDTEFQQLREQIKELAETLDSRLLDNARKRRPR